MISLVLKVLVLGGTLAAGGWAWALIGPGGEAILSRESRELDRSFRSTTVTTLLRRRGLEVGESLKHDIPLLLGGPLRTQLSSAAAVMKIHRDVVTPVLPISILALVSACVLGLAHRETIRSGVTFSSPTRAYIGKHLLVGGLVFLAGFAASPLPASYWMLWVALAVATFGAHGYVSNLPAKL